MKITKADTIALLKELVEHGESNLDVAMKVYVIIKDRFPYVSKEFQSKWVKYYNGDIEEFPQAMLEKTIQAIEQSPEPEEPKDEFANLR